MGCWGVDPELLQLAALLHAPALTSTPPSPACVVDVVLVGDDEKMVTFYSVFVSLLGVCHGGSLPHVARSSLRVQDVVTRYAHQRGYHVERRHRVLQSFRGLGFRVTVTIRMRIHDSNTMPIMP